MNTVHVDKKLVKFFFCVNYEAKIYLLQMNILDIDKQCEKAK